MWIRLSSPQKSIMNTVSGMWLEGWNEDLPPNCLLFISNNTHIILKYSYLPIFYQERSSNNYYYFSFYFRIYKLGLQDDFQIVLSSFNIHNWYEGSTNCAPSMNIIISLLSYLFVFAKQRYICVACGVDIFGKLIYMTY